MALLFVVSGIAARYCMSAHQSSFGPAGVILALDADQDRNARSAQHGGHAGHGQAVADHHQQASDTPETAALDDAGCATCCSTCTLTTGVMSAGLSDTVFTATGTVHAFRAHTSVGSTVQVDPGIPKHIV